MDNNIVEKRNRDLVSKTGAFKKQIGKNFVTINTYWYFLRYIPANIDTQNL